MDTMEKNMDENAKRKLLEGLQKDLRAEMTAIHYYLYCSVVLHGLARTTLKPLFLKEAKDELNHAEYLAEKICFLGGEPVMDVDPISPTRDPRVMLETMKKAEENTIQSYVERIEQAENLGLWELKIQLEDMIKEETQHLEETSRLLADPNL
ncbi:ferritin-like domain-containing protein [Pasteuria penetrans]|uniref:ferritin-like domain-containing protein n=1 Tax=Pasteuria penetrans TaxID=86005 RepID=UPI001FEC7C55|nr:ferritin-like domain-containing protein [Pasteuria penetrans]